MKTEEMLKKLEALIGSDDFEYDSEVIMNQLAAEGAGSEIIEALFGMMERHPLADFGMPGAMVHFIEDFDPEYIPLLIRSLQKRPALHTVWMLNRCINGSEQKEDFLGLLRNIAGNDAIEQEIKALAQEFLDYQVNA